jgi:hypothetical protein
MIIMDEQLEERMRRERVRFLKKMEEERHKESLYSFFNGDVLGV